MTDVVVVYYGCQFYSSAKILSICKNQLIYTLLYRTIYCIFDSVYKTLFSIVDCYHNQPLIGKEYVHNKLDEVHQNLDNFES